jgi:anti-sigma regulatory factor (Ser/Thr protein kinase)
MNSQWPLQDFLELGALAGAVPCARLHARHVLWEWGLRTLMDSTELLVAELVTNAVNASRAMTQARPVGLSLASGSGRVLILVSDANPEPPLRINTSDEAENGRGLMLVEAISERWGWYFSASSDRKVVWAVI